MAPDLNADFLAAQLAEAFGTQPGTAPPAAPDDEAIAAANARALRLDQLKGERDQLGNLTARNEALDAQIADEQRRDYETQQTYAPEEAGPSPDTLTWRDGTSDEVKRAFSALALNYDLPTHEAQAMLNQVQSGRWLAREAFYGEMRRTWGASFEGNLARVARELADLPFALRDQVADKMADDRFSPELAVLLNNLPARRGRSRTGGGR